jgi:hypothetical protein
MISSTEKQLLTEILMDYLKFDQRSIKNDRSVLDLVNKLKKKEKDTKLLTQQQLADEMGIDKRNFMKRIWRHQQLLDELHLAGWYFKNRGFTPKEVGIIRKWLL